MNVRKSLRLTFLAAFLLVLPAVTLAWKFASIADSRGDSESVPVQTQKLTNIVNRINTENVDLVIFSGDSVCGSTDSTSLTNQLTIWKNVMDNLNCPYYISWGNHEIRNSGSETVVRSMFEQPTNGPPGCEELVYSFDHLNAHFVCADSYKIGQFHQLHNTWMNQDLGATTKPHIFVFSHDPAYPKGPHIGSSLDFCPTERDNSWRIFATHGCRMYFCGHEHFFARDEINGVIQVINGTCGVWPDTTVPGTIGKRHYVLVNIGDDGVVNCSAKDENGVILDTWTYTVATDIPSALKKPNDTKISLVNKIVGGAFDGFFYVQEDDRHRGLRINSTTAVTDGDRVSVFGTLGIAAGERALTGHAIKTTP